MSEEIDSDKPAPNRRKVLQSIGVSAISISGFAGSAVASESERSVDKLKGGEKRKRVAKIISSDEVKALREHTSTGLRPEPQRAQVLQITERDGEEYILVTGKFSTDEESDMSYYLTWHNKNIQSILNTTVTGYNAEDQIQKRIFFEDGEITEIEQTFEEAAGDYLESSETQISQQSTTPNQGNSTDLQSQSFDPDECTTWYEETCTDPNWSCLAGIAVTYTSCAYAYFYRSIPAVLLCIANGGVSLWQAAEQENCSVCDDTDFVRRKVCGDFPSP